MPAVDIEMMYNGNHWPWFIEGLQEAFRYGVQGPSLDVELHAKFWGFCFEEIQVPVFILHGEQDRSAPLAMARHIARVIPNCHAKILPDLGHLSVILSQAEEALLSLCE